MILSCALPPKGKTNPRGVSTAVLEHRAVKSAYDEHNDAALGAPKASWNSIFGRAMQYQQPYAEEADQAQPLVLPLDGAQARSKAHPFVHDVRPARSLGSVYDYFECVFRRAIAICWSTKCPFRMHFGAYDQLCGS